MCGTDADARDEAVRGDELDLPGAEGDLSTHNHIIEPEFHQEKYAGAVERAASHSGAFQLGKSENLARTIGRGRQPTYADDDCDPDSLDYEGMLTSTGVRLDSAKGTRNVCALKSNCVRQGFIDFDLARSVNRAFYDKHGTRAGVKENDLLINSTGDGTIGRVAVYNKTFPAVVDGHITIIRFKDANLAWYSAAYLLSDEGQRQIYRYINGSSGQVEIYPQDIARLWVPGDTPDTIEKVASELKNACAKHDEFFTQLTVARAHFL